MRIKKIIGKIHLWLGLSSGLVVFILGITGCMLAFEEELKEILYHNRYTVKEIGTHRLSADQLLSNAQTVLGTEKQPKRIVTYEKPDRAVEVVSFHRNEEGWNYFNTLDFYYTLYINPYTGQVQYVENTKNEFFYVLVTLHYDLLLEDTGKQIIGYSTIIFILLLISGLILWWPRNKAAARQRFAFRWKPATKWKRKNYDLHNILGFYVLLFALIIALTGMVWAFSWFGDGVQWLANGGQATPEQTYNSKPSDTKTAGIYDKILTDMQHKAPANYYDIWLAGDTSSAIVGYSEFLEAGHQWTTLHYDQYTGKNLSIKTYAEKLPGKKLRDMNYYIHTGAILNLPGKILAFIVSLICAGLPITGFYIWWGRRKKRTRRM